MIRNSYATRLSGLPIGGAGFAGTGSLAGARAGRIGWNYGVEGQGPDFEFNGFEGETLYTRKLNT